MTTMPSRNEILNDYMDQFMVKRGRNVRSRKHDLTGRYSMKHRPIKIVSHTFLCIFSHRIVSEQGPKN